MEQTITRIGTIRTGYSEKFGIPRQSGLVEESRAQIIMEPDYRDPEAFKGIEEFSYLWLVWGFSQVKKKGFTATVTPPRLGGRVRKGVFATRSPFRPNKLGLSSVKLIDFSIDKKLGPVITVGGADLLDGTPIYDIKPYLAYTDSHPDAGEGFAAAYKDKLLAVDFPEEYRDILGEERFNTIKKILMQDPRAAYNKEPDYVYGMSYEGYDVRFKADNDRIKVCGVISTEDNGFAKIK